MTGMALEIENVSKRYEKSLAVDNVSFNVGQGEIFGLLGPNGAGKSSLINMISGLNRIGGGRIKIFGYDNQKEYLHSRQLAGVMPQEIVIDNFFTLDESLRMHAGYYGFADDPQWRKTLVERLALEPYLHKKPLQLSGGTKRRHMLAKALIHKPKLLILDEPTAGVDVELRHNIWSFVREINGMGTTVMLTTHYLEEAEEMCDRIAIMAKGKIVALDRTRDLLKKMDNRKVTVRLDRTVEAGSMLAQSLNAQVEDGGQQLTFSLASSVPLDDVLEKIRAASLRILDIQSKSADLEDVFLSLTGAPRVGV